MMTRAGESCVTRERETIRRREEGRGRQRTLDGRSPSARQAVPTTSHKRRADAATRESETHLCDHALDERSRASRDAAEVDLEDAAPVLEHALAVRPALAADAGVEVEEVDAAELVEDGVGGVEELLRVRDVDAAGGEAGFGDTLAGELLCGEVEGVLIVVEEDGVEVEVASEVEGDCEADAACACASDDGDVAWLECWVGGDRHGLCVR